MFVPLATCREATEVHVTLYSDICEKLDAAIFTSRDAPVAQKVFARPASCTSPSRRRLGDIVFVPASTTERRFSFRVRAAAEGGDCATGNRCVTASRNVAYLDHTSLQLDVDLTSDCIGVTCKDTQTCVHGTCVDSFLDCMTKTCDDGGLPADAGSLLDSPLDVSTLDALACKPPKTALFGGTPWQSYWTFTTTNGSFKEQMSGTPAMLVNGNTTSSANMVFGCGEAITLIGSQPLDVKSNSNGIGASMYVYIPSSSTANILVKKVTGNGIQGVNLFVDYQHVFQVQTCGTQSCSYLLFQKVPTDSWFSLEVRATSSNNAIDVTYDGAQQMPSSGYVNQAAWGAGSLEMGPGASGLIDELRVYDVP